LEFEKNDATFVNNAQTKCSFVSMGCEFDVGPNACESFARASLLTFRM